MQTETAGKFASAAWVDGTRDVGGGAASGKNSRNFHTLGYEMGNLQKLVLLHTQKVLFYFLKNNFIPYNFFSYLPKFVSYLENFFIPLNINFIPLMFVSYLENFFHTLIHSFHTL